MLFHHNDVGTENQLESAAACDAIDRGNDGLVEIAWIVQAGKTANSLVRVGRLALCRIFEVPPG